MTGDFDFYRRNIDQLFNWYTANPAQRNEATTRLQIIDRLFFDCLGWGRDDVTCEDNYQGQTLITRSISRGAS
jgi:hypothetical protein